MQWWRSIGVANNEEKSHIFFGSRLISRTEKCSFLWIYFNVKRIVLKTKAWSKQVLLHVVIHLLHKMLVSMKIRKRRERDIWWLEWPLPLLSNYNINHSFFSSSKSTNQQNPNDQQVFTKIHKLILHLSIKYLYIPVICQQIHHYL